MVFRGITREKFEVRWRIGDAALNACEIVVWDLRYGWLIEAGHQEYLEEIIRDIGKIGRVDKSFEWEEDNSKSANVIWWRPQEKKEIRWRSHSWCTGKNERLHFIRYI